MENNFSNDKIICNRAQNGVEYLEFSPLKRYERNIKHCYTTRFGGVSTGECKSLNFGFNRNDKKENILKNFDLLAEALSIESNSYVISNQVHDNRIKIITELDMGKGITKSSDIIGYDGLITNCKGITLVTFYADCIPVFMYDSKQNIIALLHSGWKSTYKRIAHESVEILKKDFNSKVADIIVVLGPSIGKCCFEVGSDVYEKFGIKFNYTHLYNHNNSYFIDLHNIIRDDLMEHRILDHNIHMCNVCTVCYKDYFFSYRGDNKQTGSQCAIMQLL